MALKFDKKGKLTKKSKVDYAFYVFKNNPSKRKGILKAIKTKGNRGLHDIPKIYWKKAIKKYKAKNR